MKKKIFGLDISDHSIEAVLLSKPFFGKPKIAAYARTILRGEVVKDGIIKKPEKLTESIVSLLQSAKPRAIKARNCILSLPDSQVFITIFKFPAGLRRDEIKNTIPYKAEEIIPFKADEIYFDFKTITNDGNTQEVFYAAVPKKIVDSYVSVLEGIGLVPVACDLESVSLARAVIQPLPPAGKGKQKTEQASLLIDIGAKTTNLNIFDRNGIRQGTIVNIAGSRFTKSIAKSFGLPEKEADKLKMKVGFDPAQEKGRVILILQKEFRRIIEETQKLINYYQDETGRKVGQVILAGGSSLLPQIGKYVGENINLPTEIGNPLVKILDPQKLVNLKNKSILFANTIGLSLRALSNDPVSSDINLLPVQKRRFQVKPDRSDHKAWKSVYIRSAILVVCALVLGGLLFLKSRGVDPYQEIFSVPEYETDISADFDAEVLDALREQFMVSEQNTTTPTTTKELVVMPIKIKVSQTGAGYLNVREGPGTSYAKIGQATSGMEYVLIKEEGDWYQIQFNDETAGWISATYSEKLESNNSESETESQASVEEELGKVLIDQTSLGYLNVREGPGTNYAKIGQAISGEEYVLLEEKDSWYRIRLDESTVGWGSSVYMKKVE